MNLEIKFALWIPFLPAMFSLCTENLIFGSYEGLIIIITMCVDEI